MKYTFSRRSAKKAKMNNNYLNFKNNVFIFLFVIFFPGLKSVFEHSKKGCGAKIIFPQFDTMIFTFVYLFPGDEID